MMRFLVYTAALTLSAPLWAGTQPYAGQERREIASLSETDVDAILAGRGWGLAKPAELNGYPGPAHVLELAEELALSDAQRAQVQAIFNEMEAAAKTAGAAYVESEAHLTEVFRMGHASPERLDVLLAASADALARLRMVHLAAHLKVTPILNEEQKQKYARLRGYDDETGGHGTAAHGGHSHD